MLAPVDSLLINVHSTQRISASHLLRGAKHDALLHSNTHAVCLLIAPTKQAASFPHKFLHHSYAKNALNCWVHTRVPIQKVVVGVSDQNHHALLEQGDAILL